MSTTDPSESRPSAPISPTAAPMPLSQLRTGQAGTVCRTDLSPGDRRLLSAMGLRDNARVILCRLGEPCIVRVMGGCDCSSRIGLSKPLADRVFVSPDLPEAPASQITPRDT